MADCWRESALQRSAQLTNAPETPVFAQTGLFRPCRTGMCAGSRATSQHLL